GTQFLAPVRVVNQPDTPDNELLGVGSTLYFTQRDDQYGWELWKSDGTPEGTVLVKDIAAAQSLFVISPTPPAAPAGSSTALAPNLGFIGWGPERALPIQNLTAVGNTLFFTADDGPANHGQELWTSDGTADGTVLVKDIRPGGYGSDPHALVDFNG